MLAKVRHVLTIDHSTDEKYVCRTVFPCTAMHTKPIIVTACNNQHQHDQDTMKASSGLPVGISRLLLLVAGYCCLTAFAVSKYINYHFNAGVGGPYELLFSPKNDVDEKPRKNNRIQNIEYKSGLQAIKDAVKKASNDGKRLRPYGARWAASDMPYTQDYMLDSTGLNYAKIGIENDDYVTSSYKGERKEQLAFVQSGVRLKFLYLALFEQGLTLPTSCTTDGQTMAGGVSTGAHNAGVRFGALQDFVRGIHLVLDGKTILIQKSSEPVVTEDYMREIGADELITDDDMFNAALVSFGTFGIVHAYIIEAEKLFRLQSQVRSASYSNARHGLSSLDMPSLGFDPTNTSETPWHVEALVNPYNLHSERSINFRIMEKFPLSDEEIAQILESPESYDINYYGKDLQVAVGEEYEIQIEEFPIGVEEIGKSASRLLYGTINEAAILAMMFYGGLLEKAGFPLEMYGDPLATATDHFYLPVSTTTMEPCFPLANLDEALAVVLEVLYEYPSPTALHIRYLKHSTATLAPARFDGINVCIAFNSVDGKQARVANSMIQRALEDNRDKLSFTYHWGKVLPPNREWAEKSHGIEAVSNWKMQREKLLTPKMRRLFSSDYTDSIGLTGW
jgi:FAD/FMN-containing dehydrogenase